MNALPMVHFNYMQLMMALLIISKIVSLAFMTWCKRSYIMGLFERTETLRDVSLAVLRKMTH